MKTGTETGRENREGGAGDLPPTLLQLPNLNPAPAAIEPIEPAILVEPNGMHVSQQAVLPAATEAGIPTQSAEVARPIQTPNHDSDRNHSVIDRNSAVSGRSQAIDARAAIDISPAAADAAATAADPNENAFAQPNSARAFPELSVTPTDSPVGRSWMEIAQQHGVVVVLLLIVIATAIFTGRDTRIDNTAASMADAIDLDQIDAGVPMTAHDHDLDTGVVSIEPNASPASESADSSQPVFDGQASTDDPNGLLATLEPPQAAGDQPLSQPEWLQNSNPAGAAPSLDDASVASNQISNDRAVNAAPNDFAVTGELAAPSDFAATRVDAQTVGNRVDAIDPAEASTEFNPPSLELLAESLDDQQSASPNQAEFQANPSRLRADSFVPVASGTPAGITDWRKYLPDPPNPESN